LRFGKLHDIHVFDEDIMQRCWLALAVLLYSVTVAAQGTAPANPRPVHGGTHVGAQASR
jgi:hypothetical protein